MIRPCHLRGNAGHGTGPRQQMLLSYGQRKIDKTCAGGQRLAKSADHYINVLGFSRDFAVDGWEFLSLGTFRVMLGECPDEIPASETNNHSYFAHVLVDDVDSLYEGMRSRGAIFKQEVQDKPWGMREFCVATPDGHRIVFAQETE